MFIGMRPKKDDYDALSKEMNMAYVKRKQEQMENREGYEKALEDLKEVIADEEGPEKRDQLREDRTLWITDQIAQEKFPEDLNDFYASKQPPSEEGEVKPEKKDKGDKKGAKDDKGKKVKKIPKPVVESDAAAMPKLQGRTEVRTLIGTNSHPYSYPLFLAVCSP
jgi:IQ and AAA domain-containing protein